MTREEEIKQIAENAASTWSRCYKCSDKAFYVDDHRVDCNKDKLKTCSSWYNGYRTALLALTDDRIFHPRWVSVDEELPKDGEWCVVINENLPLMAVVSEYVDDGQGLTNLVLSEQGTDETFLNVNIQPTHWLPIPQPPKKGE